MPAGATHGGPASEGAAETGRSGTGSNRPSRLELARAPGADQAHRIRRAPPAVARCRTAGSRRVSRCRAEDANCAACHGNVAQGAVKAGATISIIEEQRGKQPPDLTDDQWDHGATDAEIYSVIKRGVPPTMMAGFDGRVPDNDIWNIVNYLRSLAPKK